MSPVVARTAAGGPREVGVADRRGGRASPTRRYPVLDAFAREG